MSKRKIISFAYKLFVFSVLFFGIFLNVLKVRYVIRIISYYTLISNILCMLLFAILIIADVLQINYQKWKEYHMIKGGITVAIAVTAIVYYISLAPQHFQVNTELSNILVHCISPILVILDYFIFDTKGFFKKWYPLVWLSIPLLYVLYVYLYHFCGGEFYTIGGSKEFAYLFLDYKQIGYHGVITCLILLSVSILMISCLFLKIDGWLGRRIVCEEKV